MKVIVIGCTHAGTAAVKTILNDHPEVEVVVYERNDNISFLSCGIALYVGGVVKDPQGLFYSNPQELADLGADVYMEHDVTKVDIATKTIQVTDLKTGESRSDSYDKLVMTTGSWPVIPPFDGLDLDNILLCKNYNQAKEIFAKKTDAQKITIIGAGYIGVELVEAFANEGKEVTLIDGMDRILSRYMDQEITDIIEAELKGRNIQLHLNQMVEKFEGQAGKVTHVVTNSGKYETDMVILCVGFRPNNDLILGQLDTLPNGALIVDNYMHTSHPDVYAAGDSCAVNYNPNHGHDYIPLATNAVRMGSLIGKNILSDQVAYRGTQATSGLHLFGWNVGATGVTDSAAESAGLTTRSVFVVDNHRPEFMPSYEKIYMKLVYEVGTNRIVGGQVMSKYDCTASANTLSLAIQNEMTIEDLAYVDFFFQPVFDRPWNYLNILAQAAVEQERVIATQK